jgi:hypothetical protein
MSAQEKENKEDKSEKDVDEQTLDDDASEKSLPAEHESVMVGTDKDKSDDEPMSDELDEVDEVVAKNKGEGLAAGSLAHTVKHQKKDKTKQQKWYKKKLFKALLVVLALSLLLLLIPNVRFTALNALGVRAEASLTVVDESTSQPLKRASVELGGVTKETDDDGTVSFDEVKLGLVDLRIERRAFELSESQVSIELGDNDLGEYALEPKGVQYSVLLYDYFSEEPVHKAEVYYDDDAVYSDEQGLVKVTIEGSPQGETAKFRVVAEGYRQEELEVDLGSEETQEVGLVPVRKHVFLSNRTGNYDVYAVDADGKNEVRLLAGTNNDNGALYPHPDKRLTAFIGSSDNRYDTDGMLMRKLVVVDEDSREARTVVEARMISVIGWDGDKLVYKETIYSEAEAQSLERLMVYDLNNSSATKIAEASYFNRLIQIGSSIYFLIGKMGDQDQELFLQSYNLKDRSLKQVSDKEATSFIRSNYNVISFSSADREWYQYDVSSSKTSRLAGQPLSYFSSNYDRVYFDRPDGKKSAWIDVRDGKGAVILIDTEDNSETMIVSQSGLSRPMRWINNDLLVYRVNSGVEVADYAISVSNPEPKKISDVSPGSDSGMWYGY